MDRRKFLKFAGLTAAAGSVPTLGLIREALGATWTKVGVIQASKVRLPLSPPRKWTTACGVYYSVALRSDGKVFSVGWNGNGCLGINSSAGGVSTFTQAIGISNAVAIACGGAHTVALRSDGLVFTTGKNTWGQLGDASLTSRSTFVQAVGISDAVAIACGYNHTVALRSDGLVFTTGNNASGHLGLNTSGNSYSTFVQAIGISNAIAVAGGYNFTLALRADGLVFGAGTNTSGQLGDGTLVNRSTFVQAVGISQATSLACGYGQHSAVIRFDGNVYTTGSNSFGALANNSTAGRSTFAQAIGISSAVAVACGYRHTIAVRRDGLVFTVGQNNWGHLGDNTTVNKSTFVQAIGISNAVLVSGGARHTIALRSDGLIFGCGYNSYSQTGDATATNRSTFVQGVGP